MSTLRLIGLIIGLVGLFMTVRVYRGPRWKKRNFLLFGIFSIAVISVSLNPNVVNIASEMLSMREVQLGRITVLLIFSNIFLWFLFLYHKNTSGDYKHQFDLLVRYLSREKVKPLIERESSDSVIAIIIPAYNEEENLKKLLMQIPSEVCGKGVRAIVIDDGSIDDTAAVAEKFGCLVLRNGVNRGGGAALRLGYDVAKEIGAQVAVTMDADGQHDPSEIDKLVVPVLNDEADFTIGSRILGNWKKDKKLRFVGLYCFNFMINLLLKSKITDCSSGFRAFRIEVLNSVILKEDQFHTSELIIDAVKKGIRIREVPITITPRMYGCSKKGNDWKYGLNFAKTILKAWWR